MGIDALDPVPPRPAVFLDRDGVLIRTHVREGIPRPAATLPEVAILPGVPDALALLKRLGFVLVCVTNQPDVARGTQLRANVEAVNAHLLARLPLDDLRTCFHDDADGCACRKPRPGMLLAAARDLGLDLSRSVMVGDRWSDVRAGSAAGCLTILIDAPYNQRSRCTPDWVVPDLPGAAGRIEKWRGGRPQESQ
jgi:D-glycero-D-manno-heptose 1,7-bisphosphate phosphatase